MDKIRKAIMAILGGVITLVGVIAGPGVVDWATPELMSAVGAIVTTILVYVVPNAIDDGTDTADSTQ